MKKGWQTKRIGEIATIKPPKSEARERVAADALVSFLPMEDLGIAIKYPEPKQTKRLSDVVGSYTYFAEGDVLLAKITPCFENGKLGIAKGLKNGIGFGSSEFIVIRPDSTVSNEWLFHFLSRDDFRNEGAQRMGGAVGQQRVPKEFVENYEIPVPPLAEQQRIVGVLDEAFAGLATAQAHAAQNLQNALALFASHLQSVFTHRGKGWEKKTLGEILAKTETTDPTRSPDTEFDYIDVSSVSNETLTIQETQSLKGKDAPSRARRLVRAKDVLFATIRPTLRRIAVVPEELDKQVCSTGYFVLRAKQEVDFRFVFYFLQTENFMAAMEKLQKGASYPAVTDGDVRSQPIPIPPLAEQHRIVTQLDALAAETQRLRRLYERKQAALAALKKSLLHQAFTGEL